MLSKDLERYVDRMRTLGYKFHTQSVHLRSYVRFAEEHGDRYIKTARVLVWAAAAPSLETRRVRLMKVRRFALAMHAENARHQVPPADALGHARVKRRSPYIYTPDEIARLLRAARTLEPAETLRPLMYTTLIGLLAATGMRIAEALALRLDDLTADGIVVRETKFHKSRLLPLHATAQQALDRYLRARRKVSTSAALFVTRSGLPLPYRSARWVFLDLLDRSGLRGANAGCDPRLHDLRHTFAVRSLEQCGHDRNAVGRHIVALSTYLGHSHVTGTYWYLQATPVLTSRIAEVGEALFKGGTA